MRKYRITFILFIITLLPAKQYAQLIRDGSCGLDENKELDFFCNTLKLANISNSELDENFMKILKVNPDSKTLKEDIQKAWMVKRLCLQCLSNDYNLETGDY